MSREHPTRVTQVNPATGEPWTLKSAVAEVMPDAKQAAGAMVDARTLYYKVRPLLQKLIGSRNNWTTTTSRRTCCRSTSAAMWTAC